MGYEGSLFPTLQGMGCEGSLFSTLQGIGLRGFALPNPPRHGLQGFALPNPPRHVWQEFSQFEVSKPWRVLLGDDRQLSNHQPHVSPLPACFYRNDIHAVRKIRLS